MAQAKVDLLHPRPLDATLTVTRAAEVLGVHANTVRAWSDAGRLRYYRINPRGDRRYRLGDLHRFLAASDASGIAPVVEENSEQLAVISAFANMERYAALDRGEAARLNDGADDLGVHLGDPVTHHS